MIALVIARNTFREATRDRVLVGLVVAGVAAMCSTLVLSPLALGEGICDFGICPSTNETEIRSLLIEWDCPFGTQRCIVRTQKRA